MFYSVGPRVNLFITFAFSVALILLAAPLDSQVVSTVDRAALVIGNGAYANAPLKNPPNDAADMAALFKAADMEVVARNDLDLAGMEETINNFVKLLKNKDSAVVFYAGHGIQVNGENYLIPVKETINNEVQVRSKGIAVNDLLERIKGSGVKTIVLFLDACRDNPFPGSTRSGSRGLTVVAIPSEIETLVAYAAAEGKTAADGIGRNGVFTAALLKNLAQPGLNITEAMIKVRADVLAATEGAQAPAVDMRLARPWYLLDPATVARKALEESQKANNDLAALDEELSLRKARIAAAKDSADREALELEQKKSEAARRAQQLVAESLAKTAIAKRELAAAEEKRQAEMNASIRSQDALAAAIAARRAELERLSTEADGDDPNELLNSIERLRSSIEDIRDQYEKGWLEVARGIQAGFEPLFVALAKSRPEIWETDAQFSRRINIDKAKLESDLDATLKSRKSALDSEAAKQTAGMTAQLNALLSRLSEKTWKLPATQVRLNIGVYDRNTRHWPISVETLNPIVFYKEDFVFDFNDGYDIKTELLDFDRAVKANALIAEITWEIIPDLLNGKYGIGIRSVTVKNLESGKSTVLRTALKVLGWFKGDDRKKALSWYSAGNASVGRFSVPLLLPGDSLRFTPPVDVFSGSLIAVPVPLTKEGPGVHASSILDVFSGSQNAVQVPLTNEGPGVYVSSLLPAATYWIQASSDLTQQFEVTIQPGKTVELPGYREYLYGILQDRKTAAEKKVAARNAKTTAGWISFGVGLSGAALTTVSYFLGAEARAAYDRAVTSEEHLEARKEVEFYGTVLVGAAVIGTVGFGLTPLFWNAPSAKPLEAAVQELDEQLRLLAR